MTPNRPSSRIWATIGNGHNGYLDVWLELGFVGLGIFIVMFATGIGRAYSRLIRSNDIVGLFYALIMVYALIYSFTEKFLLKRGYCCESGCRHCPYGFRKDRRADLPVEDPPE